MKLVNERQNTEKVANSPPCTLLIDKTRKLGFYNANLTPENDTD